MRCLYEEAPLPCRRAVAQDQGQSNAWAGEFAYIYGANA
jgi:hypothetical protein